MGQPVSIQTKSVFISFAHKDAMDFTRRLAFALGFFADVFWDRQLQAGEYPLQLRQEIEARDYFLFIMTPYSLREESWCQKELRIAQNHRSEDGEKKPIALALRYEEGHDQELEGLYTYADFTRDFEVGFRRLTQMILGQAFSSWEFYSYAPTDVLLKYLSHGLIPGLISKELAEWVIVQYLWDDIETYIQKTYTDSSGRPYIFEGRPRTPLGILAQRKSLIKQFADSRDSVGLEIVKSVSKIAQIYIDTLQKLSDDDHRQAGSISWKIISKTKEYLETRAAGKIDAIGLMRVQTYFDFEVSEKLRELINMHSRRSRYLY